MVVSIELQRLEWLPEARTLRLSAYPQVNLSSSGTVSNNTVTQMEGSSPSRAHQLLLASPIQLEIFYPESPKDPPLCFGSTGGRT